MNEKLKNFLDNYMKKFFAFNPVIGSYLGLQEYDESMPDGTMAAHESKIQFFKDAKRELLDIEKETLTFDEQIDVSAMIQILEENIFEEEELPFPHSFPSAPLVISSALYTIFSRDFYPVEERLNSLLARLAKIPAYLEASKECLLDPVELWVDTGIQSCMVLPGFVDSIVRMAEESDYKLMSSLAIFCKKAKEAIYKYENWLTQTIMPRSRKDFAIGREYFRKLLELKRFGMDDCELLELGSYYLDSIKKKIVEIARKIDHNLSYEELKENIRSEHPKDFDETLLWCQKAVEQSKEYVIKSGFATMPEKENLVVKETPEVFRHTTPLAAYIPPGKFLKAQRGVYLVTRTESQEVMKDFNYTALFNKSIHECYPGHHLQHVCANLNPSVARIFTSGAELVEGWAHYCEDYVATNGFPDYLKLHFTMNLELIWKACRIIIDVKLSSGDMTVEEAIQMLINEAGFSQQSATAEVHRYTYTPCYQLSYLLGKHLILAMRDDLKTRYGKNFSDREFHDLILYSGGLPMNLTAKVVDEAFRRKEGLPVY